MNIKEYKKIVYVGSFVFGVILSGQFQITEAAQVETSITIPYQMDNNINSSSFNGLAVMKVGIEDIFDTTTRIKIDLSKTFNFVRENGANIGYTPSLDIGKTITAKVSGTKGYWGVFGADSTWSNAKNIAFGNDIYRNMSNQSSPSNKITTNVFAPYDNELVKITSSNPNVVECTNSVCVAKSGGTANVEVSFNKRDLDAYDKAILNIYKWFSSGTKVDHTTTVFPYSGHEFFGNSNAYGKVKVAAAMDTPTSAGSNEFEVGAMKTATYDFPSITYTITVPAAATPLNQSQVVTCSGVDTITSNSANIKWTYTDLENDAQASYSILVATDPYFTQGVKQVWQGLYENVAVTRNRVFQGLDSGVTYYAAVTTWNASNGWSPWATCPGNFKTVSNGAPIVTYDYANPVTSDSATIHWTYIDPEGDPQTEYEVGLSLRDSFETVPFVKIGTGNSLSASFTGLVPNTRYYVRVRAKNDVNGMSAYSTGNFTTPQITGAQEFYCSTGDPVQPFRIPGSVTYSAYPKGAEYHWNVPNSAASSESEYYKTYSSLFENTGVSVDIKRDGVTRNIQCPTAILACGQPRAAGECVNYKQTVYDFDSSCHEVSHEASCGLGVLNASFSIDPNVEDASGNCYFTVISENANSCTVKQQRTGQSFWNGTSTEKEGILVGTYTLYCKQAEDDVPVGFGTKSCYSNSNIREN